MDGSESDSKSKSQTLDMGVPQGCVVAPTLFSFMLHDIQRVGRPGPEFMRGLQDIGTTKPIVPIVMGR